MSHSTLMIERQQIWFKREDLNTTGSIKDRGISHQLNTHLNKNEKSLVISSSGNAAISASYYAKLANAKMYVFIYPDCNPEKKNRLNELGATIMESTQPLTESLEFAERNGFTHIRQATDPEATVGYQELAAEIVDQLGLEKIDINDLALFIPVSSGTAFVGLFEGFSSLIKAKKLEKYPQMHAVQSQAVHPIAGPFDTMFKRKSTSIVDAIVPPWDPPRLETVSQIINQTQGSGWVVQDTDVLQEQEWLQKNEIETSNEGALALAGYRKASKYHQLSTTPIILLTGTKYKNV